MKTNQVMLLRTKLLALLLGTLSLLLPGCSTKEVDQKPEKLIPEDKMATILADIHLAEAKVSKIGLNASDSTTLLYRHLEKQIYAKHRVDTATYNQSYTYYSSNPDRMVELYKQVVKNLERLQKTKPDTANQPKGPRKLDASVVERMSLPKASQ